MIQIIPINMLLLQVTNQFEEQTTKEINCGSCQEWAEMAYELVKKDYQVELWETVFGLATCSHFFIKIDNKFYDAECLEGVEDHMKLPIFAKYDQFQPIVCLDSNHEMKYSVIGCSMQQLKECGYNCK